MLRALGAQEALKHARGVLAHCLELGEDEPEALIDGLSVYLGAVEVALGEGVLKMAPTYTDARNYVHILTRMSEEVSWRRQLLQSDQSDGPREPAPARKQRRLLGDDSALNALCLQVLRLRQSGATWTKVHLTVAPEQEYSERQLRDLVLYLV